MPDKPPVPPIEDDDFLTILPRPQVSVYVNKDGDVSISVVAVSEDNQRVEHEIAVFPTECAREVGEALIAIANKYKS